MNLLVRPTYENTSIMSFRTHQYNLIPEFIETCFDYARRFGFEYDTKSLVTTMIEDPDYHSSTHHAYDQLMIKLKSTDKSPFLELNIPKLLDDCFFKLCGVYYIPLIYLLDEPISFKKINIGIYSIFKPTIIDVDRNRVVFNNLNIPISRFLRIWLDTESDIEDYCEVLGAHYIQETLDVTLKHISKQLSIKGKPDKEIIKNTFNELFFDKWTMGLYFNYYNFTNLSFADILDYIYQRKVSGIEIAFNDLRYKRLLFIELLLLPLFREFNRLTNVLRNGEKIAKLNTKPDAITSFFKTSINQSGSNNNAKRGLGLRNPYDVVNGYSGILALKTSFENPNSKKANLPQQVRDIHETYRNVLCPVTISNEDPGTVSSLVPDVQIDTKYGIIRI